MDQWTPAEKWAFAIARLGIAADRGRLAGRYTSETQKMNAAELIRLAGEGLFGATWQTDLARALSVDRRTVSRWALAHQAPRPGVLFELRELVRRRAAELAETDQALTAWIEGRQGEPR